MLGHPLVILTLIHGCRLPWLLTWSLQPGVSISVLYACVTPFISLPFCESITFCSLANFLSQNVAPCQLVQWISDQPRKNTDSSLKKNKKKTTWSQKCYQIIQKALMFPFEHTFVQEAGVQVSGKA